MGDRQRKSGRLYVGNLPTDCSNDEIEDMFARFGRIVDLVVKRATNGAQFAFVEFSDYRDAEDAIKSKDGGLFMGSRLRVEYPRGRREQDSWGRRSSGGGGSGNGGGAGGGGSGGGGGGGGSGGGGMRRGEYRVYIRNMPTTGSWQDLKDHMREAGDCAFADVQRDGTGVVEFSSREAMEYALRKMDGSKFRCHQGNSARISVTREPPSRRGGRHDSRSRSRSPRRRSTERTRRRRSRSASGTRSPSHKSRSGSRADGSRSPPKSGGGASRSASPRRGGSAEGSERGRSEGSRGGSAERGDDRRSVSKSPPAEN